MLNAMSITNLKTPLTRRYAGICGQIHKLERLVEETERVHNTLPELRADIAQKKDELVHLASVLRAIDPGWDPKDVQPRRVNAFTLPFKFGDCTTMAYDILRQSGRWMSVREVVDQLCRQEDLHPDNSLDQRLNANVWAGFNRRRKRGELERDYTMGHQRWRVTRSSSL